MSSEHDIALLDDDGEVAALVTITSMSAGGEAAVADRARELLDAEIDAEATPVEVGRDE